MWIQSGLGGNEKNLYTCQVSNHGISCITLILLCTADKMLERIIKNWEVSDVASLAFSPY
jgi:hypothetical protein